ncbi:MAG TPA: transcription termination/antitermination protein NusG, partial [Lactobacillus sp.]|nr:transcription termination/antitermination protein NusG [Lactobacillus sp.]
SGMHGKVTAVDKDKMKLKVVTEMFDREVTAELDFDQVDKL